MYIKLLISTPEGTILVQLSLFEFMVAYPQLFAEMVEYLLFDDILDDILGDGNGDSNFFDNAWLDYGGGTAVSDEPPVDFDDAFATAFGDIMPQALIHLPGVAVQRREYIVPRGSIAEIIAEYGPV
jgi:hypothetical protein